MERAFNRLHSRKGRRKAAAMRKASIAHGHRPVKREPLLSLC